jgi:hypothetical protein
MPPGALRGLRKPGGLVSCCSVWPLSNLAGGPVFVPVGKVLGGTQRGVDVNWLREDVIGAEAW